MDLFPHNREAYESAVNLFQHENRVCIIRPTGTGKSVIIAAFVNQHPSKRHLLLAPGAHIFNEILKHIRRGKISSSTYIKDYHGTTIFLRISDSQLEIWNPGKLPDSLTIDQLKSKHNSIPRNRLIADVFFMAGYIEAWGRGIDIMLEGCRQFGIPDPVIVEEQEGISVTFLKDIYTEEYLRSLNLNERQVKAVFYVKEHHSITNALYRTLNHLGKSQSTVELQDLIDKRLVERVGTTGRGTKCVLSGPNGR